VEHNYHDIAEEDLKRERQHQMLLRRQTQALQNEDSGVLKSSQLEEQEETEAVINKKKLEKKEQQNLMKNVQTVAQQFQQIAKAASI